METRKIVATLVLALGLMLCQARLCEATPIGTAFTYQGYLYDANSVANDFYDFQFKLYDNLVGGSQVGTDVSMPDVDVVDGSFTIGLDFGSDMFNGDARWLEIAVRPGDSDGRYSTLSPRQEVTPTPYAIYAEIAGSVSGFIGGSGTSNYVAKFTGPDAIGNSVIYESAGNIGIGTASPSEKLEVSGAINATSFIGDGSGLTGITIIETDPTVLASVKDGIDWSEVSTRPAGLDDGDDVGITSETDPTVLASVKDGISWSEVSSRPAGLDDGDDIGITSETDPTVPASVKDGISWSEVSSRPAGLDDGDDVGITSESDTLSSVCSRGNSTSGSITVNSTVYSDRFYVSDAGNNNALWVRNTTSSYPTIAARANQSTNTIHAVNVSDYGPTIWARNEHSNGANCIYARSNSSSYPTLYVQQDGSDWAGWFDGDLGCSGSKSATVETQTYGNRNFYSDESTEVYFFDRSRGQLIDGMSVIELDPIFLESVTINDSYPMLVQITLTADCKGVFVAEKTSDSFTVQELKGGTSNATFDWEVAAKRKGFEDVRMEKITIIEDGSQAEASAPEQEDYRLFGGGVRVIKDGS